ncbi:restriction endonuclease [Mesorhizobium sp. M0915]|uniref:restriction endonuclease n=1 Tax=Mesorhizobium sp. M0915 TaxID=2957027 RepID=UPI00333DC69A
MSIWQYGEAARDLEAVWSKVCPFCSSALDRVFQEPYDTRKLFRAVPLKLRSPFWVSNNSDGTRQVERCSNCGWWKASEFKNHEGIHPQFDRRFIMGAVGSLRELDLSDQTTPLQQVRDYLAARYEARFEVHPRLFEETVASVFRSLGFDAVVTAYSGDDGIDTILEKDGRQIGVQVKRYKDRIAVEQIRSLAGALVLGGMTQGIFVTTSSYQSGAVSTAARYETIGYRIHLVDAGRFYDALSLAQVHVERDSSQESFRHCFHSLATVSETSNGPLAWRMQ